MKKLAAILWGALIICMAPFGWPFFLIVCAISGSLYLISIAIEEDKLDKWRKGEE